VIVRLIGGTLGALILAAGALVLAFEGYQRYLKWLVAGIPRTDSTGSGANNG